MASSQIGGALPAQLPGGSVSLPKGDKAIARVTAAKVLTAVKNTSDPQLKAALSQTLSSLHSYLAEDSKEAKQNQGRKVSKSVNEPKPAKRK